MCGVNRRVGHILTGCGRLPHWEPPATVDWNQVEVDHSIEDTPTISTIMTLA